MPSLRPSIPSRTGTAAPAEPSSTQCCAVIDSPETSRCPFSAGLLTDTSGYFDALTAYRNGEPSAIVEKLAGASFAAATNGRQLVRDLRSIRKGWDGRLTARRGATAWRLVDVLLRQPVADTTTVARELGVTPQNALRAITPLVNAGVLEEFTGFARNRMWQSREVLDALDDFAARAGRRQA